MSRGIDGDRYSLTLKLFGLAQLHAPVRRLVSYATPLMRELAETSQQANQLVVFDRGSAVVIAQQEAPGLLGHFDPCRLPYQPVRHRLRPCAAGIPLRRRARA